MIAHNRPTLGPGEQAAAARVLASGWVAQGAEVLAFENELCRFFNLPEGHAVAVSSGSAALYLALWALDAGGLRIGAPVYSCSALRNAVGLIGGRIFYLDCQENTPNVNALEAGESVDILIAPSMFGIPLALPENRGYKIIEDIAQALGAKIGGTYAGLRGDIGICSFYATKLITTGGQGGAVISRDKVLLDKIRDYREFDCRHDAKLRFNFQMTDLQAAVGRTQLERLPEFLHSREQWFNVYRSAGLKLLDSHEADAKPVRYRIVMRTGKPGETMAALASAGIGAIVPVTEAELLDEPRFYPSALALARTCVSLPAYPSLREKDILQIAEIAREFP